MYQSLATYSVISIMMCRCNCKFDLSKNIFDIQYNLLYLILYLVSVLVMFRYNENVRHLGTNPTRPTKIDKATVSNHEFHRKRKRSHP